MRRSLGDSPWVQRLFRLPLTPARARSELDAEIRFHLAERIDELVAAGWRYEDADQEIRRRFGDLEAYREQAHVIDARMLRHHHRVEVIEQVRRETRRAVRSLLHSPLYLAVSVLTLGLGIGCVTAVFTLLDRIVLRPLPYVASERLVDVRSAVDGKAVAGYWGVSVGGYFAYRHHNHSFSELGAYHLWQPTLTGGDLPAERAAATFASASLARVLGLRPLIGRFVLDADQAAGLPSIAVLGHGLWTRRYGGDASILGKVITVEGMRVTVVGIMPAGLGLPDQPIDLWLPLPIDSTAPPVNDHGLQVIGRLLRGVSIESAQRDLAATTRQFPQLLPAAYSTLFMSDYHFRVDVVRTRDRVLGNIGRVLWILFVAMMIVLLVACTNVTNLYLVRLQVRERDLAVRCVLGASRSQIAWHLLSEWLVISTLAAVIGLGLAWAGVQLLQSVVPFSLPRFAEVSFGWRESAFVTGLSISLGIVFGALSGLRYATLDLSTLRESPRGMTASRYQMRMRSVLMASQVALALVLIATAGVLFQSFRNLRNVRPGFDPDGLVTFDIAPPLATYHSYEALESFYRRLITRLSQLPSVTEVGTTQRLPLGTRNADCQLVFVERRPLPRGAHAPCFVVAQVSPTYFGAMRIPVQGSVSTWTDVELGVAGVVVSQALARRLWPGENAIGKAINTTGDNPPFYRVTGIASDVYGDGLEQPPSDIVYFPLIPRAGTTRWSPSEMTIVMRTHSVSVEPLKGTIRRTVAELDRNIPVANIQTMGDVVASSMARVTFTMLLLMLAAGICLFLSASGIYGVIAYVVGQRRGEIGIRLALGGHATQVSRTVMLQALRIATIGTLIGLLGAAGSARLLHLYLLNLASDNLPTLIVAALVVMTVAALASLIPARRAARVSPLEALRN